MFIVTQGAANVKLGLVEVRVMRLQEAESSIAQTKATVESEMAKLQPQLDAARNALSSAEARYRKEAKAVDDLHIKIDALNDIVQHSTGQELIENLTVFTKTARDVFPAAHRRDIAKKEVASAKPPLAELERQAQSLNSAARYFASLPSPVASTKTDADGKFSIMLDSKAAVALAAHATRMVTDKVENYYWIVSVSLDGQLSKRIFLSNDNLVSSDSKDSLAHAGE